MNTKRIINKCFVCIFNIPTLGLLCIIKLHFPQMKFNEFKINFPERIKKDRLMVCCGKFSLSLIFISNLLDFQKIITFLYEKLNKNFPVNSLIIHKNILRENKTI